MSLSKNMAIRNRYFDTADAALRVRQDEEGRFCLSIASDNEDEELKVKQEDFTDFADFLDKLAITVRRYASKK